MPARFPRRCALALLVVQLTALPVLAQEAPDGSVATDGGDQSTVVSDEPSGPDQTATPTPIAAVDTAVVIAKWGPSPQSGADFNRAAAQRWFRDQNSKRARWGVPTANRDPYLDWVAENLLRDYLGEPRIDQPTGLKQPDVTARTQTDSGIRSDPEFWTVSDDLWQSWLDSVDAETLTTLDADNSGGPLYTKQNYLQLQKLGQTPRFDRFRLMGVAGRVDANQAPTPLLSGHKQELESIAPGSVAAYQPAVYQDPVVAVVGYDPWINADGTTLP